MTSELISLRRPEMIRSGAWKDNIITDFLDKAVDGQPNKTAIISYRVAEEDSHRLSFLELDQHVTRMAAGLAGMGVNKGDVVSCQLPNGWQMTALHLACIRIGAILNPLMHIFREHELRFMLRHAQSKVLVVPKMFRAFNHQAMAEGLRKDLPDLEHLLVIGGEGLQSFEDQLLNRAWEKETDITALFAERRIHADDIIQILFTSGTTGEPKGVMHTSNTLFSNIFPYAERLHLNSEDIVFMGSPMAHQTGFLYGLMMPVYLGATVVLQDLWQPDFARQVIAREKPTYTMASTPFLSDLVEQAASHPQDLESLRIFVAAGAPIPSALVEKALNTTRFKVASAWGMTENGAVTLTHPEDPPSRAIESDGVPLPFMEVKVVDLDGNACPANTEGNLLVRGASLFVGYHKRPELYEVDADGWFGTGDLARIDEQGYIRITGRTKDVVIRGGENIPIMEIENLLYKHPDINTVALVGFPDKRLGERVCAYITLNEGAASMTLDDIKAYLAEQQVSKSYFPEYLVISDDLPRTPSGKLQKFKLREQAKTIRLDQ
ncbi:cyclohexanecarboxylate-CoA ligase [Marinospirillum alkaliphilum DSM 21637]|uniref:Cyclohexanecarboxylate-CoA ligase n=2 Tax=Marinospirillum TaxID=64968 RepID=A0A1K1VN02_9GAMM|nr:cyclohexanecarboxylate-CoA ligase [Marinospirillum alkaliphilum DSM 21637]